ncbi:thermonuclease family protein [Alterinioella nitratireducens]|uniref:thermonuclease family protein n=1 Tax=Alterinioella nitratireducens TaxID=2735915 RepID=UPI004057F453|tara:strand:+ start:2242 stop:2661 length:420 start_codon:yes stop_codon:yes gene_type:complete
MIYPRLAFLSLLLLLSCNAVPEPEPTCRVTRVIDGDTVDMACGGSAPFRARLIGFDTPETYEPRCRAEADLGRQATDRLQGMVATARVTQADLDGTDRYGRRLVRLGIDGRDVGDGLIAEGLAVPYTGGRRIDWCDRLG